MEFWHMFNFDALLATFRKSSTHALSLRLSERACRWVYGEVQLGRLLHFKKVMASGGANLTELTLADAGVITSEDWVKVIRQCLSQLPAGYSKPRELVVCLPARYAYFGEITTAKGEDEQSIRYQVEDLLEAASGNADREAAFDWQLKAELSDGSRAMAVAGVDSRLVDEIRAACVVLKMECRGITLDNVASLNGYLQMVPAARAKTGEGFLLHGELNRHRIRLASFSQGVLVNEAVEQSEDGFSVVQAISALERLMTSWARDHREGQSAALTLILGGELMASKGIDLTIKRSSLLAPHWVEIQPRRELAATWHDDVVPFGALEALPCA